MSIAVLVLSQFFKVHTFQTPWHSFQQISKQRFKIFVYFFRAPSQSTSTNSSLSLKPPLLQNLEARSCHSCLQPREIFLPSSPLVAESWRDPWTADSRCPRPWRRFRGSGVGSSQRGLHRRTSLSRDPQFGRTYCLRQQVKNIGLLIDTIIQTCFKMKRANDDFNHEEIQLAVSALGKIYKTYKTLYRTLFNINFIIIYSIIINFLVCL